MNTNASQTFTLNGTTTGTDTVQASVPCKLWSLPALRFTELSGRRTAIRERLEAEAPDALVDTPEELYAVL